LPSEDYIRKHSHKIMELFQTCLEIADRQKISFHFPCNLTDEIHQSILNVLNNFSESSGRYSNINVLLGKNVDRTDCMYQWYTTVDLELYAQCVSTKKKMGINNRAEIIGTFMQQFATVQYIAEDGVKLDNPIEASKRTGLWEAVAPYRQLYILQIIRTFAELLDGLGYKAMRIRSIDIPYFSEIFGLFYNSDSYFRSRKTWDKL